MQKVKKITHLKPRKRKKKKKKKVASRKGSQSVLVPDTSLMPEPPELPEGQGPASYWEHNAHLDTRNAPETYAGAESRSRNMVLFFDKLGIPKEASVLEIGCNVGRNLEFLRQAGFTNLHGFDVSRYAIEAADTHFPLLSTVANLRVGKAPGFLKQYSEGVDVVFTMATLLHMRPKDRHQVLKWAGENTKMFVGIEPGPGPLPRQHLAEAAVKYAKDGILFSSMDLHAELTRVGFRIVLHTVFKKLKIYCITVGVKEDF